MNTNYTSINIDDLAQLARETCVYRGRSQGAKVTQPADRYRPASTAGRWQKLVTLFKR